MNNTLIITVLFILNLFMTPVKPYYILKSFLFWEIQTRDTNNAHKK